MSPQVSNHRGDTNMTKLTTVLASLVAVAIMTMAGCNEFSDSAADGYSTQPAAMSNGSFQKFPAPMAGNLAIGKVPVATTPTLEVVNSRLDNPSIGHGDIIVAKHRNCGTSGVRPEDVYAGRATQEDLNDSSTYANPNPAGWNGAITNTTGKFLWTGPFADGEYLVQVYAWQQAQLKVKYNGQEICSEYYTYDGESIQRTIHRPFVIAISGGVPTCRESGLSPYPIQEWREYWPRFITKSWWHTIWCDNPADGTCVYQECHN